MKPLLIIEGDIDTLRADGLSCGSAIAEAAEALFGVEVIHVQARTSQDLCQQLEQATREAVFDAVVMIAHGNSDGVKLCSDVPLHDWKAVTDWLAPAEPRRVACIACQSGRTIAASCLFDELESLEEIFASPLSMVLAHAASMAFLLPRLLDMEDVDAAYVRLVQAGTAIITRGLIFRYTREQYDEGDEVSDVITTMAEELLVPHLANALFEWLDSPGDDNQHYIR